MPTTSRPLRAGGHVHACIGVGSLKSLKDERSPEGISNCAKESTGIIGEVPGGVWIAMECFSKNCLTSDGGAAGAGEEPVEVDAAEVTGRVKSAPLVEASFRLFFSFFDSKICSAFVSVFSSRASRFRFFFFFFSPSTD